MDQQNATSPANPPALPEWAGEEIFRFLEDRYGRKFIDSLGGIPRERVMQAWREELIGYTPREIKRGLHACRGRDWPPNCMEFLAMCRPPSDPRADWAEAVEQMARRQRDGSDVWSRPQVYWAAAAIGMHDLHTLAYDQARARWERALEHAGGEPVPSALPALPKPEDASVTLEEARRRSAELRHGVAAVGAKRADKRWAVDILRREAAGQRVAYVSAHACREALGFDPAVSAAAALAQIDAQGAA